MCTIAQTGKSLAYCGGDASGHVREPCADHDGLKLGDCLLLQHTKLPRRIIVPEHNAAEQKVIYTGVKVFSGVPVCNQICQHSVRLHLINGFGFADYAFAGAFNNEGAQFINSHGIASFFFSIRQTVLFSIQTMYAEPRPRRAGVAGHNGSSAPKAPRGKGRA